VRVLTVGLIVLATIAARAQAPAPAVAGGKPSGPVSRCASNPSADRFNLVMHNEQREFPISNS